MTDMHTLIRTQIFLMHCIAIFVLTLVAQFSYAQQPIQSPQGQTEIEASRECDLTRKVFGYPYYYCDCVEDNTIDFQFGMDMEITDTLWFAASVAELKKGLSAYWFSSKGIRLELYALCSSTAPTMTLTVGGNTMKEMDIAFINKKLEEMGALAEIAESVMRPHLRVYPLNGGTGRVMAYPYDAGPHSTCEDLLPVVAGMTYVSNHDEDVYALAPAAIRKDQQMFVQWKQKDNRPCRMTVTRGQCDGTPIIDKQLRDSTKVYFPSIDLLNEVKASGDTLFFHFTHTPTDIGRICFRYNPKWQTLQMDTVFCEGLALQLADTALTQTTVYGPDTVWFSRDTLNIYTYNVEVLSTTPIYDTLYRYERQLPFFYRDYYVNRMGEHHVIVRRDGLCDQTIELMVYHLTDTIDTQKSSEECQGRTITIGSETFRQDTTINYSEWRDKDTYQHVTHSLHFTAPELEYDTVSVLATDLPYLYEAANEIVSDFGDHTFTITAHDQCTRLVQLTLVEEEPITAVEQTEAQPKLPVKIFRNGTIYILHNGKYMNLIGQKMKN